MKFLIFNTGWQIFVRVHVCSSFVEGGKLSKIDTPFFK